MSTLVHGRRVIDALIASGIADEHTQRVIIDIPIDGVPLVHVQKVGDEKLLDVLPAVAEAAHASQSTINVQFDREG
jgi:hypothetical protein